jgi:ribonuclease inhibitor
MPVKRSVRKFRLSGKAIGNLQEFYDEMVRKLPLPDYFGRNLDALWDVLTTDIEGPVELVWEDSAASKKSMGKAFDKVSALLRDVEKEREDFQVIFC